MTYCYNPSVYNANPCSMSINKPSGIVAAVTLVTAMGSVAQAEDRKPVDGTTTVDPEFMASIREAVECVLAAPATRFRRSTLDELPASEYFEEEVGEGLASPGRMVEFDASNTTYTVSVVTGHSMKVYVRPKGTRNRAEVETAYDQNLDGTVEVGSDLASETSKFIAGWFDIESKAEKDGWEKIFRDRQREAREKQMTPAEWEAKWKRLRANDTSNHTKYTALYRDAVQATVAHCRANLRQRGR